MAHIVNLVIDQGSDYSQKVILYTDDAQTVRRDLTGWGARMQIRRRVTSPTPEWSGDTATSGITINDPTSGEINFTIPGSVSKDMDDGNFLYDLEIYATSPDRCERMMQGSISLSPEITR